jgi:hypothetical protein
MGYFGGETFEATNIGFIIMTFTATVRGHQSTSIIVLVRLEFCTG